jgi:hypothetical protein
MLAHYTTRTTPYKGEQSAPPSEDLLIPFIGTFHYPRRSQRVDTTLAWFRFPDEEESQKSHGEAQCYHIAVRRGCDVD